jgi:hypothetical protein
MARLQEIYKQEIVPRLMEKFKYQNVMEAPKVDRVVINIGVGEAIQNSKALVSDKKITQDFILLYMVSMNEEALKVADIISKMMKLPVWYINDSYKKDKYKFKHIRGIGPLEFLVLVKNAKFIVTTSFHGTAFSIIFNKKFVTVPYKRTSSRMVELLKRIKLENRIIEASSEFDSNYEFNIDYTIPNEMLEQEKEKSLMFLKEALAIKNN